MAGMTGPGAGYERAALFGYLRTSAIFSTCDDALLELVEATGRFEQHAEGATIVAEGDHGEECFVVVAGSASVERDGRQVGKLGRGALFGELALFDPAPRNASVIASERTTLVVFDGQSIRRLMTESTGVLDEVLRGMARRLHQLDEAANR